MTDSEAFESVKRHAFGMYVATVAVIAMLYWATTSEIRNKHEEIMSIISPESNIHSVEVPEGCCE